MRFETGKQYVFVNTLFHTKTEFKDKPHLAFMRLFDPSIHNLERIDCRSLTCTEHHRVRGGYSDEIKYDGFRFTDAEGKLWDNQWPSASYGQIDDSADRQVAPSHYGKTESDTVEIADFKKRFDAAVFQDKGHDPVWANWTLANHTIENIVEAIFTKNRYGQKSDFYAKREDLYAWQSYMMDVIWSVEEAKGGGDNIFFMPWYVKAKDDAVARPYTHIPRARWVSEISPTMIEEWASYDAEIRDCRRDTWHASYGQKIAA